MTKHELRRWATPAFGLAFGVILAAVYLTQDQPGAAATSFLIMAAYSALLVLGRGHETVGLLGSGDPDERRDEIGRRAALFAGYVLITVVLAAFVWELAHGRDGQPYTQLGAISGVSFIAGTIWYRRTI